VEFTAEAKKFIIDESFDIEYGARPLKRYIQRNVETLLAKAIINSDIEPNDFVEVAVEQNTLFIRK
jgi:ATP-dependent Clp protease ATP-binding subunit ClpB